MHIAVWKTGHEIADRVAESLWKGIPNATLCNTWNGCASYYPKDKYDVNIAYGILRGATEVFRNSKCFFNLDRGYFRPSHYDGYYRISCGGTQATGNWVVPGYSRLAELSLLLAPWRGFAPELPVLVIPPTEHAAKFFNLNDEWSGIIPVSKISTENYGAEYVVRQKGAASPINFADYNYVLTFNSSVGWQALQAGIPCVSDPTHSMVGAWFKNVPLDSLAEKQLQDREKLFATMAASQFTLQEIEQGKAWSLVNHYTSGSAMMAGKLSPLT